MKVTLHLTNLTGAGAIQLALSLLTSFQRRFSNSIELIYLPEASEIIRCVLPSTKIKFYKRSLPKPISRVLECTIFSNIFNRSEILFVLGDLPLKCSCYQVVLVHNSLLISPKLPNGLLDRLKLFVSKEIFRMNAKYANAFIVQSELMKSGLLSEFSEVSDRVFVIPQPPPDWLLSCEVQRSSRFHTEGKALRMIYPAVNYPHKNHELLSNLLPNDSLFLLDKLYLTINSDLNPAPSLPWIDCVGFLNANQLITFYSEVDGLLFLSKEESYGFPLVEAMFVGLPIVCPDLPYARHLCGDEAIYFDPYCADSLRQSLENLKIRIDNGWWPCWDFQLKNFPKSWEHVAELIFDVFAKDSHH
jgi:glycosyltransferase involved in cell wall biosynthesis